MSSPASTRPRAAPSKPKVGVNTSITVEHSETAEVIAATRSVFSQMRQALPDTPVPRCTLVVEERPAEPYSVTDFAGSTRVSKRELTERQYYARQERENLLDDEDAEAVVAGSSNQPR